RPRLVFFGNGNRRTPGAGWKPALAQPRDASGAALAKTGNVAAVCVGVRVRTDPALADTVVFGIYHYHIDPFFLLMLRDGGASGFFDMSLRTRLMIGLGFSFFL